MPGKISGTLTVEHGTVSVEPVQDLVEWRIDPDAVINLLTALHRNLPEGQYFFDISTSVEPTPE